jgi:hypothetical protein
MSKAEFTPHLQSLHFRRYSRMWTRTYPRWDSTLSIPSHALSNSMRHDITRCMFHLSIFYKVSHKLTLEFNHAIIDWLERQASSKHMAVQKVGWQPLLRKASGYSIFDSDITRLDNCTDRCRKPDSVHKSQLFIPCQRGKRVLLYEIALTLH